MRGHQQQVQRRTGYVEIAWKIIIKINEYRQGVRIIIFDPGFTSCIKQAQPQRVRSEKTNTKFRRFAVQTKATAGVRSNRQSSLVTFCDDRK